MSQALQFLVFTTAGWLNRQQEDLIAYVVERALERRNLVLNRMTELGWVSHEAASDAREQPLVLRERGVLSQNILTAPEESIPDTEVDITIVGGEVRYERAAGGSKE